MNKIKQIILVKEIYYEIKKISWPSLKNVLHNSILVTFTLIFSSLVFFLIDSIFYILTRSIIFKFYYV